MTWLLVSLILFSVTIGIHCVAKFEVTSVSDSSLVIKMVEAGNVTNFDITVQIFDLSKQRLFRRTQLDHVKNDQEMVIKTKKTSRDDPKKIEQMVAFIDDLFVTKDNIYIGVGSVFKEIKKISTVIVPELRCSKGVLSPVSQQVIQHASFHFDLSKLPKEDRKCSTICVFPYLRILTENAVTETFRAKEWCGSAEEARHLLTNRSPKMSLISYCIILILSVILFH
ncbi:hypothetical protein CRE_13815 [Caenorhabditis remanei]|uniref:Uncharacterized protein n=1 Tax=Caenorhabditis remanei TaxID=31234 RepID=E3NPL2_CAERE|nr:hypothetical protein CRE_13815 [Caenorhabditis remanei]